MRIMADFFGTISEGRVLPKIFGGVVPLVFYFRPKNVIFPCPNPFLGVISKIHTRFQTYNEGQKC